MVFPQESAFPVSTPPAAVPWFRPTLSRNCATPLFPLWAIDEREASQVSYYQFYMFCLPQRRRGKARNALQGHGLCLCLVVMFCFQFGRFYLTVELGQFQCLDTADIHVATSAHHTHAGNVTAAPPDGYSIEHCKDTLDGIPLTPVQPFGTVAAVTFEQPQLAGAGFQPFDPIAPEHALPTLFQPPRV